MVGEGGGIDGEPRGFVAGLEYATGTEATVLGKPSPSYFAAALDARVDAALGRRLGRGGHPREAVAEVDRGTREVREQANRSEYGSEPRDSSALQLLFLLPVANGEHLEILASSNDTEVLEGGIGRLPH